MDTSTQEWVAALKAAYPHLPNALNIDLEIKCLERLERWFTHVNELREYYDKIDRDELPESVRNEPGKRQVIPVLMSLEHMTQDEVDAWHTLFVCLSAQLADIGTGHWKIHNKRTSTMSLADVLNYLPIIFLFVLSSFNPFPGVGKHEKNFSHSKDGRVRLITWVTVDTRRHIATYLQQHLYTIRKGSGYIQRLRSSIRKLQNAQLTSEGRMPTTDELIDSLAKTHQGQIVKKATLSTHVQNLLAEQPVISLSETTGNNENVRSDTLDQTIEGDYYDIEEIFDPATDLETDISNNPSLKSACNKLLHTDEVLTYMEMFYIGA